MAQAGRGSDAFASLDQRRERQEEQAQTGLDKVFFFQGVVELFHRMKIAYGRTPAWTALMKCNAIYLKDFKTAIGVEGTRYGLFFAEEVTKPTWSPDIGANMMTLGEKACIDAQNAKHERLQASLKTTSGLVHQVMEKTREAKENLEKANKIQEQLDKVIESNKTLHRKIQEKNREKMQEYMVRLHNTQKDRDDWVQRCSRLEQENVTLQKRLKEKENALVSVGWDLLGWIVISVLVFGLISLADAQNLTPPAKIVITPGQAEFMDLAKLEKIQIRKYRLESCELPPEKGCVLYKDYLTTRSVSFLELMAKCTKPDWISESSYNETILMEECTQIFGAEWCEGKLVDLVPRKCSEQHILVNFMEQIEKTREVVTLIYGKVMSYRLDMWITSIFSLVLAGNKEKLFKMAPFILVAWFLHIPVFLTCVAVNIFPLVSLPFILFQIFMPQFVLVNAFLLWLTLTLTAFYWNEGPKILMEVSYAVVYTIGFVLWSLGLAVGVTLKLTMVHQILMFCVVVAAICGTRFACATITVQHPDGTTTKYTRVGKLKTNVVNQCKKMVTTLQTRGVIPATPAKTASIVIVEGKNGTGVGFRFMNYILTAEHVVQGSDIATLKNGSVSVKSKVVKTIPIFESVDNVAVLKLPPELNSVKPIKLAKKVQSDYLTLTAYDPNFQHAVTYTGWCIIDGNWLNNSFDTKFGNSGAPYCDHDGRLVGIHLGTQGVLSQGIVIVDALKNTFQLADQCRPQNFDMDEFLEKVIAGTKVSHAAILKELEELREEVQFLKRKCVTYDDYWLCQTIFGQAKKGKTKKTVRGRKHLVTKRALSKGHFMKMRMLTDEEYQNMIEKGFSAEEIREAVNELREQAWLNYCIDNDIDDEGEDDWYDDMVETDRVNQEIDEAIERAMEDRGEFYQKKSRLTFVEQAMMHLIQVSKERSQTAKLEVQKENEEQLKMMFERCVTDENTPEGTTSVAVLSTEEDVRLVEGKIIDFSKAKNIPVDGEIRREIIPGTKCTEISTGPENKKNILKKKDTHMTEGKVETKTPQQPVDTKDDKPVALEQRKPRACKWCGSSQKHDFRECRFQREKRFCVYCAAMHSMFEGHIRSIECTNCKKSFPGIEKLEDHVVSGECQKN
nr:non-structural polyprotein [Turkey astrovirus]